MSETKKRMVHSPEFKAKVAMEALRGLKTLASYAESVGKNIIKQKKSCCY